MHPFLQQLLQGQAVEWRALGEVCDILDNLRKPIKASLRLAGSNPYYGANNIQDYVDGFTHDGEYVLIAEDGSSSLENYSIQWATGKFWANNHVHVVSAKECLNNRFLFHFLKKMNFIPYLTGGTRAKLTKAKMIEIQIPIPPLSVQSQIVQILDTFTELTAELTAELSMRQKQYQYYRDFLLSEHELAKVGFEWKSLGELGIINRGKRVVKNQLTTEGSYPVYQNSLQPLGYFDKFNVKANTTFMITAGAAGEIGYSNCAFWSADDCYYFDCPKDVLDDRFLYHSLKKQQNKIFSQVRKASIPRLGRNSVENIKIPIPPLSVQSQIVAILDKFDHLTSSITDGLPKEIELRRKQYEHYRELLLGFDN